MRSTGNVNEKCQFDLLDTCREGVVAAYASKVREILEAHPEYLNGAIVEASVYRVKVNFLRPNFLEEPQSFGASSLDTKWGFGSIDKVVEIFSSTHRSKIEEGISHFGVMSGCFYMGEVSIFNYGEVISY